MLMPRLIVLLLLACNAGISISAQDGSETKTPTPILVGDLAPDFTLEDQSGRQVTLSAEVEMKPVVLVFYRGYWCPYCGRQLSELRSLLEPNEKISLWAVSVDSHEQSKSFAEKIASDGRGNINFQMLSDPGHRVIDSYGLRDPRYAGNELQGIPYPAVYVIDKSRRVVWARVEKDFKVRPRNSEIRAALQGLK